MTVLTTRELYGLFLDSDWWIHLSRLKRRKVGCCEKCRAKRKLQSHHVCYRENWFDTKLSDLQVLCRDCHESHHKITKVIFTPNNRKARKAWKHELQQRLAARKKRLRGAFR